jgi:hypothetical protein
LGEERSPLYLRGGRLWFERLRKKFSHWGWVWGTAGATRSSK